MPRYQYRCKNCGHEFEAIQAYDDPPLIVCPSCNGGPLRKIISVARIIFKGSGFYSTDSQ